MKLKIELPSKPIPWNRAGHTKNFFYDTQFNLKKNIRNYVKENYSIPLIPVSEALRVTYLFEFCIPKSWSKKKKIAFKDKYHKNTPDTTNCMKFIEDTFNDFIYVDDKQIASTSADKIWSERDCITIIIEVLEY